MRFFGARRHCVTTLQRIGEHADCLFDLVNGVLGWGIDTAADANAALTATARSMRHGGTLVLGVNETRPTTPRIDAVPALAEFHPAAPPPFGVQRLVVPSPFEGTHTFVFFERP